MTGQCNYFAVELAVAARRPEFAVACDLSQNGRGVASDRLDPDRSRSSRERPCPAGVRCERPTDCARPAGQRRIHARSRVSGWPPPVPAADAAQQTDNGPRMRWKGLVSTRFSSSDATNCDRQCRPADRSRTKPSATDTLAGWPTKVNCIRTVDDCICFMTGRPGHLDANSIEYGKLSDDKSPTAACRHSLSVQDARHQSK